MSSPISGYNTSKTGAAAPKDITKTDLTGDKVAIDVAVKELVGNLTGSFSPSGLTIAGEFTQVSINDTGWTLVPATALTDRNQINIQNFTGFEVKIRFDNTGGYLGMRIPDSSERFYQITESILIYARAESGAGTVTLDVEELA